MWCILRLHSYVSTCTGPVQSLIAASVSATSITLQWTVPLYKASSITEYRVEYRIQSESLIRNATINPTQTVFTVTDLTPGTSYQLRVIPVNSIGDGPQANVNSRTGTQIHDCVSPKSLFCREYIVHLSCTHTLMH